MKILYCDDSPNDRKAWLNRITKVWEELRGASRIFDGLELRTCSDISDSSQSEDSRSFSDVAPFDGFLLDLLWSDPETGNKEPHGLKLAQQLREKYPEKAIMMFTVNADPLYFHELVQAGICGYLRKGDTAESICFQLQESMARHRKTRGGHCLYNLLRSITSADKEWAAQYVGDAATKLWNLDRSHDRWKAFWSAFQPPVALHGLTDVFSRMQEFFRSSDLLLLGTLPGMRGHLDHVLNVYFTGYVISHSMPCFRQYALAAAKRLFPDQHDKITNEEPEYWARFQLAWLAAATLHDTAYPLEILPDLMKRHSGIVTYFSAILKDSPPREDTDCLSLETKYLNEIEGLLYSLYGKARFTDLLRSDSKFELDGVQRINHGVASGLLFISLANKALGSSDAEKIIEKYMNWAAAAMALHSLKKPGSEKGVSISAKDDPLSYLLMICDEIQVWNRERPDAHRSTTPFRSTDLVELAIKEKSICARIAYTLHSGETAVQEFHEGRAKFDRHIDLDKQVLTKYLSGNDIAVQVEHHVPSQQQQLATLCF